MKKNVRYLSVVSLISILLLCLLLSSCGISQTEPEQTETSVNAETPTEMVSDAGNGQTQIQLDQAGITVSGEGASVSGNTLTITRAGTYIISGVLADGQILVDAGGDDTVLLSLSGTELSNSADAAIRVENAGQTVIFLETGTVNRIQSGTPPLKTADENASEGAIYARDNLAITGNGTLQVLGYINNGIQTTNNLTIDSGTIEVTAANHGIKGKDSVDISGGTFKLTSGGDGIQSDDTSGEGYGMISISDGSFDITSTGDGVQAETALNISGGDFTVISGGGSASVTHTSSGWGDSDSAWDLEDEGVSSAKGFKCGALMTITGGSFTVDSYDDAFHSNTDIHIAEGTLTIAAGDDGIHADTALHLDGGAADITRSYEGLEANQIYITGGTVSIAASDDGINAYGGSGWGWGGSSNTTEETPNLTFAGGTVYVNSGGDGIDSNGNIYMEGGSVIVDGPENSMNGAIDSGSENGGSCLVTGGTALAIGASGMAETFDESSEQCSFRHNFSTALPAGTEIVITDADGSELFRHTAAKRFSSVVFSSPELTLGSAYTLTVGVERVDIVVDSVSTVSGQPSRWNW